MPIVPTYDIPQVTPGALPAARQTTPDRLMPANSIGAEQQIKMGAAGQQFGNTLNDIEVAHQIIDNENKSKNTVSGFTSAGNAVTHGTPDDKGNPSPDAYLTKSGQEAVDSYDVTQKTLQDLKQKALDDMDNDAQRQLAKPMLDRQYEAFATKVAEHKDQQLKVAGLTSSSTLIAAKADSARTSLNVTTDKFTPVADLASPEANTPYQHDLRTVINEANHQVDIQNGVNFGRNGGDDATVRAQLVKTQVAKVYVSVLDNLLHGGSGQAMGALDPASLAIAKGYYAGVKDQLPDGVRTQYGAAIDAAEGSASALDVALKARDGAPNNIKGQASYVEAQYRARAISKTAYDGAMSELSVRNSMDADALNKGVKSAMGNIYGQIQDAQQKGVPFTESMIPAGTRAFLNGQGMGPSVRSMFNASDNVSPTPATDQQYLSIVGRLAANPADYLLSGPRSLVGEMQGLPRQQQAQVMEKYLSVDKNAVKNNVTMQQVGEVSPVLAAAGIIDSKGKKTPQYEPFVGAFQQAVSDWQDANKRKPTTTELNAIAKGQLQKVTTASHWYGDDTAPVFALGGASLPIPQADAASMTAAYRKAHGVDPTPIQLQSVYKKLLTLRGAK